VPLDPSGRLVIEQTEALTAIDIDLGDIGAGGVGGVGGRDFAAAVGAAVEAAGQAILLRNLAGLIVLDPPRLRSRPARDTLLASLRAALAEDRSTHRVHGFTAAGLIELTRARRGPSLGQALTERDDTGRRRRTLDALAFDCAAALRRAARAEAKALVLAAPPRLAAYLTGYGTERLATWLGRPLRVVADGALADDRFELR
jgi:Ribonuclease G/E